MPGEQQVDWLKREMPAKALEVAVKYPIIQGPDRKILFLSKVARSPDEFKDLVGDQVEVAKVNGKRRIVWKFEPVDLHLKTGRVVDDNNSDYVHDRVIGPYKTEHRLLTRIAVLEKTLEIGKDDPGLLKKPDKNRFERELFGLKLSLAKNNAGQKLSLSTLPREEAIFPEKFKGGVKGDAVDEKDTGYDKFVNAVAHPFTKEPIRGSGMYAPTQESVLSTPTNKESKKPFKESERGSISSSYARLGALTVAGITTVISISACSGQEIPPAITDIVSGTDVSTQDVETTEAPTEAPTVISTDAPAGSETQTATEAVTRLPVTVEDVKNVGPSLKLGIDEKGNLTGLPEGTTQDTINNVKDFYDLAKARFPDSTIYYDQDVEGTRQYILYAISPDGKLQTSVVSYGEGKALQFNDYPIDFYDEETKEWKVNGEYTEVDIPGGTIGVIWKNGFSQFLADKITLPNGDTVFTKFMEYKTYAGDDPWHNVSGMEGLAQIMNVEDFQVRDGVLQEMVNGSWADVEMPTEAGKISEVVIQDGSAFALDQAGLPIMKKETGGIWEANYYTLDDLPNEANNLTDQQKESYKDQFLAKYKSWDENRTWYAGDAKWYAKTMFYGDYINLSEKPLVIQVSENEFMHVYVAARLYFVDINNNLNSTIVPVFAGMPDGVMYSWAMGQNNRDNFVNWEKDEINSRIGDIVNENQNINSIVKKGRALEIEWLSNAKDFQVLAKANGNDRLDLPGYYLSTVIDSFNNLNSNSIQGFTESGEAIDFLIPFGVLPRG